MQQPGGSTETNGWHGDDQHGDKFVANAVPVSAYWDLSTSHIALADLDRLHASRLLAAYSYLEGAFVSLDPHLLEEEGIEALTKEGFSSAFVTVIRGALAASVHLVRFDADAPRYGGNPVPAAGLEESGSRCADEKSVRYAETAWGVGDLTSITRLSDGQAASWLAANQGRLRDRGIEQGWEVLTTLLGDDGIEVIDAGEADS